MDGLRRRGGSDLGPSRPGPTTRVVTSVSSAEADLESSQVREYIGRCQRCSKWRDNEGDQLMYYSDGGPAPATKLLRVHAPEDGDFWAWMCAPAERWTVNAGW